ncbi:hypothetical protein SAMN05421505_1186 [Sinosporangium album]|uniref:Tn3 transposase DDE domain-containing protein n=1 Tax=Sinosporangium album TaxID=504805 RepID=A0A1G8DCM1_9ACTN|nr:hypothetical protein [Sinosporangium album]SDH55415.1 hypothetical protein SAMN05421505_1186 [Sinosporangium album]
MTTELGLLNDRMPKMGWLDIAERKSGAIRLTPAEAQPEPQNLRRIKGEVQRRWGVVPLIDMLKEAVLRTGCLDALQDILGEPEWARLLTSADRRGLTPLFWSHVRPYGEVNLDMGARLDLAAVAAPGPRAPADVDEHRSAERT